MDMLIGLFALNEAQSLFAGPSAVCGGGLKRCWMFAGHVGEWNCQALCQWSACPSLFWAMWQQPWPRLSHFATNLLRESSWNMGWQLWVVCQSCWRIRALSPNSLSPKLKWYNGGGYKQRHTISSRGRWIFTIGQGGTSQLKKRTRCKLCQRTRRLVAWMGICCWMELLLILLPWMRSRIGMFLDWCR